MFLVKLFEFIVGAIVVFALAGCFFLSTSFIVGLHLDLGYQDALVFLSFCFYFFIGTLVFVDFEEK